ncbi:N-acetyltransferase [Alginatibacterium sediminis]|uniref:N-acetyltransferase n=1 Tax=Alginatibacterium sediminis TaxID=2164068 RepID=A0A420EDK6_9ALTE|nr:N-acetyltransferase [Alginatibacterium sediminis]RKF18712.1 N-acetyltransferase [Alginatibacterium sediminis]
MIREYRTSDIDTLLDIWLTASLQSHHFIAEAFWRSQAESMRNIYIPASKNVVYEENSKVLGFYCLHEDSLAAIFVAVEHQGKGIGKALLSHAKAQCSNLSLSVYKDNTRSLGFYLANGFEIVSEQADPHTGHPEYTMKLVVE